MISFRLATSADDPSIRDLLDAARLPSSDVATAGQDFIVAVDGRDLVACVGLEVRGENGLLRSFAVEERRRALDPARVRVLAIGESAEVRRA